MVLYVHARPATPIHHKGRLTPRVKAVVAVRVTAMRGVIIQGNGYTAQLMASISPPGPAGGLSDGDAQRGQCAWLHCSTRLSHAPGVTR